MIVFLSDMLNNLHSGLNKEYRVSFNILGDTSLPSGPHSFEVSSIFNCSRTT